MSNLEKRLQEERNELNKDRALAFMVLMIMLAVAVILWQLDQAFPGAMITILRVVFIVVGLFSVWFAIFTVIRMIRNR